ncbi:MAG TPA: c-type cytochrome [Conexibacter sp.]|nr:c-type cytochrome [Conexibacter sp.]
MRRATACVLLLVLALAGCGSDAKDEQAAAAAARARAKAQAHARRMEIGRRLFGKHCASCHTLEGRPFTGPIIEWKAPNLDHVQLERPYVRERVEYGGPAMASFVSGFSEAQFEALVDYITETAGREVVDDGGQPAELISRGRALFAQHCAACHGIEGRAMLGRPTYGGMDFNRLKPSERFVIARMTSGVLPDDPEPLMPSFTGRLTRAQMHAVAAYVTAVANEGPNAPPPPSEEEEEP